jgi:mono/diheme cytochrome c family protein
MHGRHVLLAALIGLSLTTEGGTQEIGQPGRGRGLATQLCAQCHAVLKQQGRSPNTNAPSFEVIAAIPGMTATALSAMLNSSHRTMPNIMLTADEQANIIAYILSLK